MLSAFSPHGAAADKGERAEKPEKPDKPPRGEPGRRRS
jgi:hypothetical protein